ncbi:MAG: DUF2332 domain-containing protein [Gammaproteobacteria bacterium]
MPGTGPVPGTGWDPPSVAANFRVMARSMRDYGSPLHSEIMRRGSEDAEILALAGHVARGQPVGSVLLSVVHALVLQRPHEPLAAFYRSVTAQPRPAGEAWPVFREFCLRNADEIAAQLAVRTFQQTTADRATYVAIALAHVAAAAGEPLSLVEIGCSAGVLLLFDRYRYDFGVAGSAGDAGSPVQVACATRGSRPIPVPAVLPRVARRVGIDLLDFDPRDEAQRRWLIATLYPEWVRQRANLRAALEMRAATPIEFVRCDAISALPGVLPGLPDPICIYTSHCLYQWAKPALDALQDALCVLSRHRRLHFVTIEVPGAMRGTFPEDYAAGRVATVDGHVVSEVTWTVYAAGAVESSRVIAHADGYGHWIEWLGD